ncbi:MAG: hypothetical protein PHD11_06840 [Bacteroidales bacterium]|nr:hypothetical protein [Bacteroidales bacterium]MDD4671057.1 hypothetical protein [Bacteroidales bacterium]
MNLKKISFYTIAAAILVCSLDSCNHKKIDPVEIPATVLSDPESANSYIACYIGQKYAFRADVKGNGMPTASGSLEDVSITLPANATISVLWQYPADAQLIYNIGYDKGSKNIVFNTTGLEGNVIIGIFEDKNGNGTWNSDGSEPIVWSWHIWCTYYDPNAEGGYHIYSHPDLKGTKSMDRNLGAFINTPGGLLEENILASEGLNYQFGRKDPFIPLGSLQNYGTDEIPVYERMRTAPDDVWRYEDKASSVNMDYAVKHPTTLITNEQNWLLGENNAEAWGYREGNSYRKTIYDPCPPGWRVPDSAVYKGIVDNPAMISGADKIQSQFGAYYIYNADKNKTFIPASGYIITNDNDLRVGMAGRKAYLLTSDSHQNTSAYKFFIDAEGCGYEISAMTETANIRCVANE